MIYDFSNKISDKLVGKNVIKQVDAEIYTYGFELIISTLLIMITEICLGIIFNCLFEVLVFILFFCSLRLQAGGYHADTHLKCFSFFTIGCFSSIGLSHLLINYNKSFIIIFLILIETYILVLRYAPVDTLNKPFTDSELIKFRKTSYITITVQVIIISALSIFLKHLNLYYMVAAFAILFESLSLLPIINNKKKEG
ncbi:MAG: accessory gene regulator B family protein [Vallitalea sp.]|nr:accessory gene regulator B family protein [Vallitalea sp.]